MENKAIRLRVTEVAKLNNVVVHHEWLRHTPPSPGRSEDGGGAEEMYTSKNEW